MLETSRVCVRCFGGFAGRVAACGAVIAAAAALASCAAPEVVKPAEPAPIVKVPEMVAPVDTDAPEQEAKAMLAQAETDIQRARSKRALWLKAWEALVLARQAALAKEHATTVRHAKRASELAQLGLEQLAFPAVN